MKTSRLISLVVLIASVVSIAYGFSIRQARPGASEKFIGGGTVGIFLVAMPLFLITESRGKKLNDYMLTRENIDRMKKKSGEGKI